MQARYMHAVALYPSVRLSVCHIRHCTIEQDHANNVMQGLCFLTPKILMKFHIRLTPTGGAKIQVRQVKVGDF